MGNYNPDAPFVIGNEFAGMRNEGIQLGMNQNTAEYGYKFTVGPNDQRTVGIVNVYNSPDTSNLINLPGGQVIGIAVYAAGTEDQTGPIRRVMINASSGAVSGNDYNALGPAFNISSPSAVSGAQMAATVYDPSTGSKFTFKQPTTVSATDTTKVIFWFDTKSYAQQLYRKRILAVNIYMNVTSPQGTDQFSLGAGQCPLVASVSVGNAPAVQLGQIFSGGSAQRIGLGEVTPFYNPPITFTSIANIDSLPWNWGSLGSFDPSTTLANRLGLSISRAHGAAVQPAGGFDYTLNYVAMEIIYCEETRLLVGGKHIVDSQINPNFGYGEQFFFLYVNTPTGFFQQQGALAPGDYSIFVSAPSVTQAATLNFVNNGFPPFNALRPYYDLSTLYGLQINKPWPIENAIGQQFEVVRSEIIPTIIPFSATGATPVSPYAHVYQRRDDVGVFNGMSPSQTLDLSQVVVGSSYGQIRFYARHFNDTAGALSVAVGASTASITVAAFNALPDIMDGWKEVTLTFNTPYVTTGSGTATLVWSDSTDTVSNRWEILGQTAFGYGNRLITPTGATSYLGQQSTSTDVATYLSPSGTTAQLTWLSPAVSAIAADPHSDATVMLSQTPPTPVGLTVTTQSQALTGIGIDCGTPPNTIPTGMSYNHITWTSPALTGSGFGFFELQRLDTVDNTWYPIMKTSSQAVLSFNDYEARIGIPSTYRLRIGNAMNFVGAFATSSPITIPAPGISGANVTNGILTFTSNEQLGVGNLAYTPSWDGTPSEDFTFVEAQRSQLQVMYGKDFLSAFQPTERGGEQFSRTLLVQAASVPIPVLEPAFRNLRDLGWAQLPYVCVRNEVGDRWFANVNVPSGRIMRNRRIQLVDVQITQISAAPSVVDPAS
jgi:hypothetical protein